MTLNNNAAEMRMHEKNIMTSSSVNTDASVGEDGSNNSKTHPPAVAIINNDDGDDYGDVILTKETNMDETVDGNAMPTTSSIHPSNEDGNDNEEEEEKMFYTTSDLMKTMNETFASVMGSTNPSSSPNTCSSSSSSTTTPPMVELQRRLPDGSTKRADNNDLAAADLQSKIKQAAQMTSTMSPAEKIEWAKELRKKGNKLYGKKKYKEAMDVYVTCLVGMDDDDDSKQQNDENQKDDGDANNNNSTVYEIKLPVLLNLSLCAIQLKMGKKAEQFCNFALESIPTETYTSLADKNNNNNNGGDGEEEEDSTRNINDANKNDGNNDENNDNYATFASKAYFRRAKARIIMGKYNLAKLDLEHSLNIMQSTKTTTAQLPSAKENINNIENNDNTEDDGGGGNDSNAKKKEIDAIKKELHKLGALQRAAVQNKRRHEKAVRVVLGGEDEKEEALNMKMEEESVLPLSSSSTQQSIRRRRTALKQDENHVESRPSSSSSFDMVTSSGMGDNADNVIHCNNNDTTAATSDATTQKRAYSTLRSNKKKYTQPPTLTKMHRGKANDDDDAVGYDIDKEERELNCFQWFLWLIIQCLRYTLYLLGDENPDSVFDDEEDEEEEEEKEEVVEDYDDKKKHGADSYHHFDVNDR